MKNLFLNTGKWLTLVTLILITANVFGQPDNRKEKIETFKISYLTKQLDLTREEAQRFWPVYNEYQDEMDKMREANKEKFGKDKRLEDLTDEEVEKLVDARIIMQQQELDIRKKYHAELKSVLPIKKVARLYRAEVEFKKILLNHLKGEGKKPSHPPK